MKPIILALLVLSSGLAGLVLAQTAPSLPKQDPRIAQLEMALNQVQQEQQAVYQQFQMTQELRRNDIQENWLCCKKIGSVARYDVF
jgi:hypothetical protein